MGTPQLAVLGLMFLTLGLHLGKHGEIREYNFWGAVLDFAITYALLEWGGFWGP